MNFAKAHGLGNDFILVRREDVPAEPSTWAQRLCDRHLGVGGDGILAYGVEPDGIRMRLINADGRDAEISGNGVRCLAAYAFRRGWLPARHTVLTVPGPRPVVVEEVGTSRYRVETDLGLPRLRPAEVPISLTSDGPVVDHGLEAAGRHVQVTATSLGNPHCAVFLGEEPSDVVVASLGPALEKHPVFPQRTNVEFVTVLGRDRLRVRFWERGVGPTQSSGTGSASASVAAILKGLTERKVTVVCDGGLLEVEWPEGGSVRQVGEVEVLFEGEWLAES